MQIQYINNRLFVDGINCKKDGRTGIQCSSSGCPFRAIIKQDQEGFVVEIEKVNYPYHWHDLVKENMNKRRKRITEEKNRIENGCNDDELISKHFSMELKIRNEQDEIKQELIKKEALKEYTVKKRNCFSKEIKETINDTQLSCSAISMVRLRELKRRNIPTNIQGLIETNYHMLLGQYEGV